MTRRIILTVVLCGILTSGAYILADCAEHKAAEAKKAADRQKVIDEIRKINMSTPAADTLLLRILIQSRKAQRGIEVGTAVGFGSVNMGIGFERTGGHLYGVEISEKMVKESRENIKKAGLEIVYDKSYPLGTQDLSPIVKGAKASKADAFVAWSYPPDTFGLTQQAKIQGLGVKAFYTAVATAFPAYGGKFGKAANGNLGAGGINPDTSEMMAYAKAV